MKVLVTGAYGFIGSAVTALLLANGHQVVGVGRRVEEARRKFPDADWIHVDIARAVKAGDWLPNLRGVDAVVNCAGLLQDSIGDDVKAVQIDGTIALFAACEQANVRRVIHVSAIGIDRETPTKFTQTKLAADNDLQKRDLDWVILRPSVVYGRNAYGGSALLRASAALPGLIPVFPDTAELQVVHLDDVARTVKFFLAADAPKKLTLELAGPERLPLVEVIKQYRRWLGLQDARDVRIPRWLASLAFRAGDFASWLGWRPPVRTTAQQELARGATGDPSQWIAVTGIRPRSLQQALSADPAGVQDKWFARLFLLKPLMIGVLVLFWIGTGLLALGPGYTQAVAIMREAGAGDFLAKATVIGGSLADLAIGAGIAWRATVFYALLASIALSLAYLIAGTLIVPQLWADPLGPLVKIPPVLIATFATLAILDDR